MLSQGNRTKFVCQVEGCEKKYLYSASLKKHILGSHQNILDREDIRQLLASISKVIPNEENQGTGEEESNPLAQANVNNADNQPGNLQGCLSNFGNLSGINNINIGFNQNLFLNQAPMGQVLGNPSNLNVASTNPSSFMFQSPLGFPNQEIKSPTPIILQNGVNFNNEITFPIIPIQNIPHKKLQPGIYSCLFTTFLFLC
jgi:hypothetical protein